MIISRLVASTRPPTTEYPHLHGVLGLEWIQSLNLSSTCLDGLSCPNWAITWSSPEDAAAFFSRECFCSRRYRNMSFKGSRTCEHKFNRAVVSYCHWLGFHKGRNGKKDTKWKPKGNVCHLVKYFSFLSSVALFERRFTMGRWTSNINRYKVC